MLPAVTLVMTLTSALGEFLAHPFQQRAPNAATDSCQRNLGLIGPRRIGANHASRSGGLLNHRYTHVPTQQDTRL
jgi:hypothetical protein